MKKRKKKNNNKIGIGIGIIIAIIVILCIILGVYETQESNELTKELKKDGYTTENTEDAFYEKIVTNNTLDEYYQDILNNQNTRYEEYYFSKASYDFIEVKLSYQEGVTTSLNISSNLRTLETTYNYELSYKDAYLIIEANSTDEYVCRVVVKENIAEDTIRTYCNRMKEELEIYLERRTEMLENKKVQELLNSPIEEAKAE